MGLLFLSFWGKVRERERRKRMRKKRRRRGEGEECRDYIETLESECLSVVSDSAPPWTVACQAPVSMEFSRPEYWGG